MDVTLRYRFRFSRGDRVINSLGEKCEVAELFEGTDQPWYVLDFDGQKRYASDSELEPSNS